MGEVLKFLWRALWPVRAGFETDDFYVWRIASAAIGLICAGAIAMNYALAFGIISLWGFTGFAQAGEVADLKLSLAAQTKTFNDRSADIMGVVIGGQIFEIRVKQCAAQKAGNPDLYQSYSQQLQGQLDSYWRITGRGYSLQPCP